MVITEGGIGLGVVSRSLLGADAPEELGYMTAVSVEPVYQMLAEAKLLPECQSDDWDGLWNSNSIYLEVDSPHGQGTLARGIIEMFDDGKRLWLSIRVHDDPQALSSAVQIARERLRAYSKSEHQEPGFHKLQLAGYGTAEEQALRETGEIVAQHLEKRMDGVRRRG